MTRWRRKDCGASLLSCSRVAFSLARWSEEEGTDGRGRGYPLARGPESERTPKQRRRRAWRSMATKQRTARHSNAIRDLDLVFEFALHFVSTPSTSAASPTCDALRRASPRRPRGHPLGHGHRVHGACIPGAVARRRHPPQPVARRAERGNAREQSARASRPVTDLARARDVHRPSPSPCRSTSRSPATRTRWPWTT